MSTVPATPARERTATDIQRPGVVGTSTVRADGIPKVTGEFEYSSDMRMDGMLWGATLRSAHPRADIWSIDISRALNFQIPKPINIIYYGTHSEFEQTNTMPGFLPENMQFWSISGRAGWYGKKGNENEPLPGTRTAVEFNSEPIRLTFDASKAAFGAKYTHFVDLWVAYRYWQNKFGIDHNASTVCNVSPGVSNHSCTESTVYGGITVKF